MKPSECFPERSKCTEIGTRSLNDLKAGSHTGAALVVEMRRHGWQPTEYLEEGWLLKYTLSGRLEPRGPQAQRHPVTWAPLPKSGSSMPSTFASSLYSPYNFLCLMFPALYLQPTVSSCKECVNIPLCNANPQLLGMHNFANTCLITHHHHQDSFQPGLLSSQYLIQHSVRIFSLYVFLGSHSRSQACSGTDSLAKYLCLVS